MQLFSGHKRLHCFFAVIISSLLLFAGWPAGGFAPLLLVAWIPALTLEDYYFVNRKTVRHKQVFGYGYLLFILWNILTTWWIYFATGFGMAAAIICNSLFMATVFSLFHFVRCRLGSHIGYLSLLVFWTGFEYLHLHWDLSWPWLTLGNGFASYPKLVQWYEFTGILGGTVWILLCNVLVYQVIRPLLSSAPVSQNYNRLISFTAGVILLPVVLSEIMYYSYTEKLQPVKVAVVQPNIDPYHEKFGSMSGEEQVAKMLQLSASLVDSSTDYLVAPETALPFSIWEDQLPNNRDIRTLKSFLKTYPNMQLITGAATSVQYKGKPPTITARQFSDSPEYYDSYNTALQLDAAGNIQIYHKSQLVIGVEKIPYPKIFGYFEKFAIDLGGAAGSLGTQPEPSVFKAPSGMIVAPAICYESIYGDYIREYIQKGARLIFIITNDGWWGNSPGYRQHLVYASLRAIETRRSIARSANTGISAFINQRGDIIEQTGWWVPAILQRSINANDALTYYVRYGDYIGIICSAGSILLFLSALFRHKKN